MPIPKPTENESRDKFMERCMSDSVMNDEYTDSDQRMAICSTQWEDRNKGGKSMEMERKSIQIQLKDDTPGSFTARIAQFDVIDADGDVTLEDAFPDGKSILISSYQHGSWMGELPVGKAVIHKNGTADGQFNLASDSGKEHYETVKFTGELQEWSYGFRVLEQGSDKELEVWAEAHDGARPSRIIKKVDPFEISPVLKGAGVGTATLAIKSDNKEGQTFVAQADAVLAAVDALVTRAKSLADLRRKEGRTLSNTSIDHLDAVIKSLTDLRTEVKAMQESQEPVNQDTAQKLYLQFLKIESEFNGGIK